MLALASASRPLPWGHPLLYDWSAEGQKLYAWLRMRVEEHAPAIAGPPSHPLSADPTDADDPARAVDGWRARGYLATYATAEQIIESVLPVSRNTVTKLLAELLERRVCVPRRVRRGGHVFLLGEWGIRHSSLLDADLYWQCYYLDGLLGASAAPTTPGATPAKQAAEPGARARHMHVGSRRAGKALREGEPPPLATPAEGDEP